MRRCAGALLALAVALAAGVAGGCGFGPGRSTGAVTVTVTRDFGTVRVARSARRRVPSSDTVMRVLERSFDVRTRFGGGFVEAIDGRSGGRRDGRPVDWFYYVNGIEARAGAAATKVHGGDLVLWDLHDWSATMSVPAIVGSFPEPFLHGTNGRRPPLRLECATDSGAACDEAARRLLGAGLDVGRAALGTAAGRDVARILVGPWSELRNDRVAEQIAGGPRASGVYARPEAGGRRIAVLDPSGAVVRRLGAGTGLVAATRYVDQQPTWVVTGTDLAGLRAAAAMLGRGPLSGRFAAVIARGRVSSAPAEAAR
jgi:Domain of unknown function (DUF4430)